MADDIDIEEHDPMDNPRIADMFLELPCIKSEPIDYEDNYSEYSGNEDGFRIKEEPIYHESEQTAEELSHQKYVLKHHEYRPRTSAIEKHSNIIILGSKPCPRRKKFKTLFISLEDWGEKLNTSPCYCKECMILFATRNALDAHNMSSHSFLVAVDAPKEEDDPKPKHKFCNHCQTYFEDEALLIQHLYNLIQAKQMKSKDKPQPQTQEQSPNPSVNSESVNIPVKNANAYKCCKVCKSIFKSNFEFNKHCIQIHGTTSTADTIFIPHDGLMQCKFCPVQSKTSLLHNRHIRVFHNSIYYRKVGNGVHKSKNTLQPKKLIVSKAKNVYSKSNINMNPNLKLGNIQSAKNHQRNLVKYSKLATSDDSLSTNTHNKSSELRLTVRGAVPKNILFKCEKCPKYFLNCIIALTHSSQSHSNKSKISVWKCPECYRVFRKMDKELHELQHRHTREFKVYEMHPNIYARVLCRCTKCNVYFEERPYHRHTTRGCSETVLVDYCSICKLTVNNSVSHNQKHVMRKFIKSDFILIEDFVYQTQTNTSVAGVANMPKIQQSEKSITKSNLKRKNLEFSEPSPKRQTLEVKPAIKAEKSKKSNITMYYCKVCQTYLRNALRQEHHMKKKCHSVQRTLNICSICGLLFITNMQLRRHKTLHTKSNIHLKDYKFVCIRSLKPCTPPLPTFRKCSRCSVFYISNHATCKINNVKSCKACNKSFTEVAFRLHMLHHKYMAPPLQVMGKSIESTLKMKYRMLKPTWNILYNCKACDVTTDSYDNVIDHCQKHYNQMQSYDVTIMNCKVCDLNFDSKCYNRHVELHENQTIDRDSFTILNYDYFNLFTNNWLKIFSTIPAEQMTQILDRSIYVTRIVKMTMLQNGPPEYTLYKCQSCNRIVANNDICVHVESNNCDSVPSFKCAHCGLDFATERAQVNHSAIHKKQSVTANSFRVVAFNHPGEIEFNATLRSEYAINSSKQTKTNNVEDNTCKIATKAVSNNRKMGTTARSRKIMPRLKYKYFQCQKCYCCSSKQTYTNTHVCVSEANMRICSKCNCVFNTVGLSKHKERHKITPMTAADIVIVSFNTDITPGEWRVDLSKCNKCLMKFPSHLITSHNCIKTDSIPTMRLYRCSGCKNLYSDKENLAKHEEKCNKLKVSKMRCDNSQKEVIYKCNQCDMFMMSKAAVDSHNRRGHKELPIEPCSICGWKFTTRALRKHVSTHHLVLKLSREQFHIIPIDTEDISSSNKIITKNQQQLDKVDISEKELVQDKKSQPKDCDVSDSNVIQEASVHTNAEDARENYKFNPFEGKRKKYGDHKNTLFRCDKCDVCYLHIKTWMTHDHSHKEAQNICECSICGVKFTGKTYKKHMYNHKVNPKEVYNVITPTKSLNKGIDGRTFDTEDEDEHDVEVATSKSKQATASQNISIADQASPEPETAALHENIKHNQNSPTKCINSSPSQKYTHKLYKCGECNVYFMASHTFHSHMLHHTPIESKEFIECKLCSLPFKIMALPAHIKKHHKGDFNLDEVLVEEHTKDGISKTTKIEIYYAIDKVQSRLVSTTSDEANCGADLVSNNQPSSSTNTAENPMSSNQNVGSDVIMEAQSSFLNDEKTFEDDDEKTVDESSNTAEDRNLDEDIRPEENVTGDKHTCRFCGEVFNSNASKEFHESLDHLDGEKSCEICKSSFNISILNTLHLDIKNGKFRCCLCNQRIIVQEMTKHSQMHMQ